MLLIWCLCSWACFKCRKLSTQVVGSWTIRFSWGQTRKTAPLLSFFCLVLCCCQAGGEPVSWMKGAYKQNSFYSDHCRGLKVRWRTWAHSDRSKMRNLLRITRIRVYGEISNKKGSIITTYNKVFSRWFCLSCAQITTLCIFFIKTYNIHTQTVGTLTAGFYIFVYFWCLLFLEDIAQRTYLEYQNDPVVCVQKAFFSFYKTHKKNLIHHWETTIQ